MKQETEKQKNASSSPTPFPNCISELAYSSGSQSVSLAGQIERIAGPLKIFKSTATFMTDSKHLIIEMMTLNTQNKTKKSVILFISSLSSRALISEIVSTK